jgi:hypothetical protein
MRPIFLCAVILLAACAVPGSQGDASPGPATTAPTERLAATPSPTAVSTLPVPAPETPTRPHYELYLTLDYAAHLASVEETITYTNQTGQALGELVLAVEPRRWPAAFTLTDITINGEAAYPVFDRHRMTVKLAQPLGAGQSVSLEIEYGLQIPLANRRYLFGYNNHQTNLLDWYPFVVPYLPGKGWVLHDPAPVGEHLLYESADFDVYLKFVNTATPPQVAAGAPGIIEGEWTHYRLQAARGFPLSASERFLSSTAQAGQVLVTSYYFDGHQDAGQRAAEITAQAVQLFSETFVPYPYESLSVVESASADGMEADGLFFMGGDFYDSYNGTHENYLSTLSVHETAHQWWYGLVGSDQAEQPWLDEALATYSERIFYENYFPASVEWWWHFRIRRYEPVGFVNDDIYTRDYSFRTYTNATYFMGAYMLEDLRVLLGDKTFLVALSAYAKNNSFEIADADAFFRALDENTSVDYSDIVNQYFK